MTVDFLTALAFAFALSMGIVVFVLTPPVVDKLLIEGVSE